MNIQWHYLLLSTIYEWNVKKTQINNSFESILDEDVPYSIVVKNITAEETRDMFKAFAIHFFYVFLYIIYSICSIRKSLKQHFFTNSEAATGGALRKFAKFTGKQLSEPVPVILLKNSLWHRCFLMNFANFLRTPFLQNIPDDCFY